MYLCCFYPRNRHKAAGTVGLRSLRCNCRSLSLLEKVRATWALVDLTSVDAGRVGRFAIPAEGRNGHLSRGTGRTHIGASLLRIQSPGNKSNFDVKNWFLLILTASVVQLGRISSIMRVVLSSSPDWSKNFLNFHITYDCRGMDKWFGAHYNQEVRFSSADKCKKGPQVLTSLLKGTGEK